MGGNQMTLTILLNILAAVMPSIAGLMAMITSLRNAKKIQEVHLSLNGRLTQLLTSTKLEGQSEGRKEERELQASKPSNEVAVAAAAAEVLSVAATLAAD